MKIHDTLPNGYAYADAMQTEHYSVTGSVNGASKVCYVRTAGDQVDLAVKLKPPTSLDDIRSNLGRRAALAEYAGGGQQALDWYVAEYRRGWAASRRQSTAEFDTGYTSHAYDDGYLDASAGRMKWHLTYCLNHDECGEA